MLRRAIWYSLDSFIRENQSPIPYYYTTGDNQVFLGLRKIAIPL